MRSIAIIGAGAWGTALAIAARRAGSEVVLRPRSAALAAAITQHRENAAYLPGVTFDPTIRATAEDAAALACDAVLLAVPAQFLGQTCRDLAPHWRAGVPAVICAKGIEQGTHRLMSEVVAEILPQAPVAVLSGPTFAAEVARFLPTAVTLACADAALGAALVGALGSSRFRPYLSRDLIGAQVGGAVKNVLAIGCGIVAGAGLGDNARSALITRGLAEIGRLGAALGAQPETLMGLSGLGDLVLTCGSLQSRNFSLGAELGRGLSLQAILAGRSGVTEGVYTAQAVVELATERGVELPICAAMDRVLNHGIAIDAAVESLLSRPFTTE